ncbi:MAG: hypothetical protein ACRDKE_08480 [Solirubrobacterales bacterium]
MRKKIALLSLVSAFVIALVAVPAANAAYIYVTVGYEATNLCRTAPDVLTYKLKFKAKIKRSGVPKPAKVRIGYQVLDSSSLAVVRSGVTNLKRSNGYSGKTSTISGTAGQGLTYHLNMKYTVLGKTSKSKISSSDTIPSVEQMDAAGVPNC